MTGYRVGDQHPSMPFEPGDLVRAGDLGGVFEVLAFDGGAYRLRAESGAELRAGRHAVRLHRPPDDKCSA